MTWFRGRFVKTEIGVRLSRNIELLSISDLGILNDHGTFINYFLALKMTLLTRDEAANGLIRHRGARDFGSIIKYTVQAENVRS